jgi:preprotein translocase subunit SecB
LRVQSTLAASPCSFVEEFAVSRHHLFLAIAIAALLFPTSRRVIVETARAVIAPIVAVLFLIAMRLR